MKLAVSSTGLTDNEFAQDCSISDPLSPSTNKSEIMVNESPETALTTVSGTYLVCSCSPPTGLSRSSIEPYPMTPESKSPPPSSVNSESRSETAFSLIKQLSGLLLDTEQDIFLAEHGYQRISKITDTMQGELWKAKILNIDTPHNSSTFGDHLSISDIKSNKSADSNTSNPDCNHCDEKWIVIKSVDQSVRKRHEVAAASQDGVSFIVEEDLYKESLS